MPTKPARRPPGYLLLDTILPGSRTPASFRADSPLEHVRFPTADALWSALPGLQERLATLPRGLLVGICPYPSQQRSGDPAATAPQALLFREHDRLPAGAIPEEPPPRFRLTRGFSPDTPPAGYLAGVRRVIEYLRAGDAYQVNLALRFSAGHEGDPLAPFLALRQRFRPPHAAFVDLGGCQILCLSPESFLDIAGDTVTTRPIKGTRPRGADKAADSRLAGELAAHPKDRAENLMIVDLLRNDLGKVCVPGSIRVPELFTIESYPNVHHLVSTVTGTLAPGHDAGMLLAAAFPGGSITGAPKRRAMEIIAELEAHPRDVYCGSIFWALPDGSFGSNIAIRTFVARDGVIRGWAGAGIVSDSDPDSEYAECLHKLRPLMDSLADFGN